MYQPNQIHPDFLGAISLNPWQQHTSSSRSAMISNHVGQMLVINGSTERFCQTGMEREYAKYTFAIKMPCNGEIIEIIERYKKTLGKDSIDENPQTILVYEDVETKQIGIVNLLTYCSNHQYFGFQYKTAEGLQQLRVGAFIKKDTIFLNSPSVTPEGGYKYGLQANVAYMTHPATSEDSVVISQSLLPKLGFKTYESRVVEWGSKKFALNLYGDKDNYKPFPDIGDTIREDGVLMALRSYDPSELAIVEQSVEDAMKIDYTFDTTFYVNGPGGKVVDIKIHHDALSMNYADKHMDLQAQKYDAARRQFYTRIVQVWEKYNRLRGEALQITPEFHRLVVEAQSVHTEGSGQRISKLYRQTPLDDYRVEFVVEYNIEPNIGFKITDVHGGKGVMCQIVPEEEMPIDSEGNRAEIIMDPNSTISRMNLGRLYEQYINSASRDTHKKLCNLLAVTPSIRQIDAFNAVSKHSKAVLDNAWNYLMGYYQIVSPRQYAWFENDVNGIDHVEYLADIVEKGITLYIPTDNEPQSEDIILQLEEKYKPVYGPVSYIGNSGRRVVTKDPIRIGSVYFILLEKIGDDWSAVSSAKVQHFGVPSQLTKQDKYAKPARQQAVRGAGEAEVRIFISYISPYFMAEMMDRNNNPKTHKTLVNNLLSSAQPSNIPTLINRMTDPFGGAKPIQLAAHLLQCSGVQFKYEPYVVNPIEQVTYKESI